jgi:hypothetical protein
MRFVSSGHISARISHKDRHDELFRHPNLITPTFLTFQHNLPLGLGFKFMQLVVRVVSANGSSEPDGGHRYDAGAVLRIKLANGNQHRV